MGTRGKRLTQEEIDRTYKLLEELEVHVEKKSPTSLRNVAGLLGITVESLRYRILNRQEFDRFKRLLNQNK